MPILSTANSNNSPNPDFIKPTPVNNAPIDPIFSQRINRTHRNYNRAHLQYNPTNEYSKNRRDGVENVNRQLMQTYPDLTTLRLIRVSRLLIPKGQKLFEDAEGNPTETHSCIIYTIESTVADEDSCKAGVVGSVHHAWDTGAGKCSYEIGCYQGVVPNLTFDRNHEITNSKPAYFVNRYYCKDSPNELKHIADKYNGGELPNRLTVGIAGERGPIFEGGNSYFCPNATEFMNESIPDLIESSRRGLLTEQPGGVKTYKSWKQKENQLISEGLTKKQLESITPEDITKIIASKEAKEANNKKQ